jgi:hypothetical protein
VERGAEGPRILNNGVRTLTRNFWISDRYRGYQARLPGSRAVGDAAAFVSQNAHGK